MKRSDKDARTGELRGTLVDDLLAHRVQTLLPPSAEPPRRGVHERRELDPGEERVWSSFIREPPYASVTLAKPLLGRTVFYAIIPPGADPLREQVHLPRTMRDGRVTIHLTAGKGRRTKRSVDD